MESCTASDNDGTLEDLVSSERRPIRSDLHIQRCISIQRSQNRSSHRVARELPDLSPRILRLRDNPDPRELRTAWFCAAWLALCATKGWKRGPLIEGRSGVLLDAGCAPGPLSLALLKLRRANVRDAYALTRPADAARLVVENAAEARAPYEMRSPIVDSRARAMFAEGERLLTAGRHAGAERALRAASAAFDRRNDSLPPPRRCDRRRPMASGRATDPVRFENAHDAFSANAQRSPPFVRGHGRHIETDLGLLRDAEPPAIRASASAALKEAGATELSTVSIAATLFWQERYAERATCSVRASQGTNPETCARYWCLLQAIDSWKWLYDGAGSGACANTRTRA